ncbi:phage tail protein [Acuticoccus sediminis]|uniref:phage tail protein n=1 Tax=Acuticoccus sediminis TaxID=2184697 RepID=UPI001CFD7B9F|nr:phage tail protein [Acuticoccus sediminis]
MRLVILAALFAVAASPAHAGFIAGAAGLVGLFSGALGTALKVGLVVGSIALQLLFSQKPKIPKPDDIRNTKKSEEGDGRWAIGRMEVEGVAVFGNTKGYEIYRLIAHAYGPLVAIEEYFYDGRPIIVEQEIGEDFIVTSPPFVTSSPIRSYFRIQTRDGDGRQQAFRKLVEQFPAQWTEDHHLNGIACSLLHMHSPGRGGEADSKKFDKILGGGLKNLRIRGRWGLPYDPRIDDYAWTDNGVLIALWARMQLPGAELQTFDFDGIGDMADEAEVLVPTIRRLVSEFDGRVDIEGPDNGEIIDDGTCVTEYDWENRVITGTGGSATATNPLLRWTNVLEVGATTKAKLVLSGPDKDLLVQIRYGGVAVSFTRDETITVGGSSVRIIEGTAVPDTASFVMRIDGTGGAFEIRIDTLEFTVYDTRKRCTLSGGGEGPIDTKVVEKMYECAGIEELRTADGKVTFRWLEDDPDAEFDLTEDDILEMALQNGPEGAERPNLCRVKYLSPERQYKESELPIQLFESIDGSYTGPAWARIQDEIDKYGEKPLELTLIYCTSAGQAAERARYLFHMARAISGEVTTLFSGLYAINRRIIDLSVPDVGTDGAMVPARTRIDDNVIVDDDGGTCNLSVKLIPALLRDEPWDVDRDSVLPSPKMEAPQYEAELDKPDAPFSACAVQYQPGGDMSGAYEMRVRYSAVDDATKSEANYRTYTGSDPDLWQGMTEIGTSHAWLAGNYVGEKVDFRVRMFNGDDEGSDLSDLLEIASLAIQNNTPNEPSVLVEVQGMPEDNLHLTITAPAEISVVQITVHGSTYDVRPLQTITHDVALGSSDVTVEVWAETTDGTESTRWEYTWTAPEPEGP